MNAQDVDKLLRVNGFHSGGYIPVCDRERVAEYVIQQDVEIDRLRYELQKALKMNPMSGPEAAALAI